MSTEVYNIVKCQSGDMVSAIKTNEPITFSHDNKVNVVEMGTGKKFSFYLSDITYIIPVATFVNDVKHPKSILQDRKEAGEHLLDPDYWEEPY